MAPSSLEHFIRFGTDAVAIERMLRMVQAIVMVVMSQRLLISGFTKLVALGNQYVWVEPRVADIAVLIQLRGNIALARRFFRIFRFLESFHAAHVTYTSFYSLPARPSPAPAGTESVNGHETSAADSEHSGLESDEKAPAHTCANPNCRHHPQPPKPTVGRAPLEAWLDIFSRTFNGMYLLLESLTLFDALTLPGGFSLFGRMWTPLMNLEGQRFWFFALTCGIGSALLKLFKLIAYGPPPAEGYVAWPNSTRWEGEGEELAEWEKQRERMRRMVWARREGRRLWMAEIRSVGYRIARRCVADTMDLVVPGSVVGWVNVAPGTVGWCMVISTWFTGLEVWERCGG